MKNVDLRNRILLVGAASLLLVLVSNAGSAQVAKTLPKVGTIKDYPATGLMVGCGNLYFYKAGHKTTGAEDYVFLSRGDGSHAWMNLNGRDVLLRKIKSRGDRKFHRYSYSYRNIRITVELEEYTPQAGETDHTHKMRITFRRGPTVRVIQAVGGSDC